MILVAEDQTVAKLTEEFAVTCFHPDQSSRQATKPKFFEQDGNHILKRGQSRILPLIIPLAVEIRPAEVQFLTIPTYIHLEFTLPRCS